MHFMSKSFVKVRACLSSFHIREVMSAPAVQPSLLEELKARFGVEEMVPCLVEPASSEDIPRNSPLFSVEVNRAYI